MALLREPLLLLSRSGMVKQLVSTMPVSAGIVKSYVPGESTDSAVEATRGLVDDGLKASLDFHLLYWLVDIWYAQGGTSV